MRDVNEEAEWKYQNRPDQKRHTLEITKTKDERQKKKEKKETRTKKISKKDKYHAARAPPVSA